MRVLDGRVWRYALIDRPPQIALDTGLYEFHAHAVWRHRCCCCTALLPLPPPPPAATALLPPPPLMLRGQ